MEEAAWSPGPTAGLGRYAPCSEALREHILCSHTLGHLWLPGPQEHTAHQTTSQTAVTGSAHFPPAPGTQGLLLHTRLSCGCTHTCRQRGVSKGTPCCQQPRMTGRDTALMEYYTAVRTMPLQQPLREPCGITLTSECREPVYALGHSEQHDP